MKKIFAILILFAFLAGCSESNDNSEGNKDKSGMQFVEMPSQEIPVVYFYIAIKSGSTSDPQGKEGLAWFTANLMQRGTKSYSREDIENGLEDIGGRLNIRVDREVTVISGQTLLENLGKYYAIFSDIILNPAFPDDQVENLRTDQEQALKDIVRNDARLSEEALISGLYKGLPTAHPVEGYFSSISKLTSEDAREFYKKNFVRGNIICGIAGSYPEAFTGRLKGDLSMLPAGTVVDQKPAWTQSGKTHVLLVEKPGKDQAQIRMGRLVDYDRTETDAWFPLLVANGYLGQHRESFGRLYTTIRAERGLSYGAYSYLEHFQQSGWSKDPMPLIQFIPQYFSIWTYPKRVNTEFAIKMALYELHDVITNGIPDDQLSRFMDFQANHYPFLVETLDQRLARSVEDIYYGLPSFMEDYEANVYLANLANMKQILSQNWSDKGLLIVVVADSCQQMKEGLLTRETPLELPSGATSEGLDEINQKVMNYDLGLTPEEIEIVGAEELFH